jgi:drug/metabolite transporter (DMT)-like permease
VFARVFLNEQISLRRAAGAALAAGGALCIVLTKGG